MNARQRRKVQKIKDGPWAAKLWRGKAWHTEKGMWVKLWPNHPEWQWIVDHCISHGRIYRSLKRGAAHE